MGEGDLSFGAALAVAWGAAENLTATRLRRRGDGGAPKPRGGGRERVDAARARRARARRRRDAAARRVKALRAGGFDRVVFNFPHAGAGIKDQKRNIETNQALLRGFFDGAGAARERRRDLTLAHGPPCDSWDCVLIAARWAPRAPLRPFEAARFASPAHRRTLGDDHAGDARDGRAQEQDVRPGVPATSPSPQRRRGRPEAARASKQRRGPNVKKSRDDERFLKRMRGGR